MANTTWVEISFKNYRDEPITPTGVRVKKNNYYGEYEEVYTNGMTGIIIGHHQGGGDRVNSIIENSALKLVFANTTSNAAIENLGTIQILSITTAEREYNEFKFE